MVGKRREIGAKVPHDSLLYQKFLATYKYAIWNFCGNDHCLLQSQLQYSALRRFLICLDPRACSLDIFRSLRVLHFRQLLQPEQGSESVLSTARDANLRVQRHLRNATFWRYHHVRVQPIYTSTVDLHLHR